MNRDDTEDICATKIISLSYAPTSFIARVFLRKYRLNESWSRNIAVQIARDVQRNEL